MILFFPTKFDDKRYTQDDQIIKHNNKMVNNPQKIDDNTAQFSKGQHILRSRKVENQKTDMKEKGIKRKDSAAGPSLFFFVGDEYSK